MASKLYGLLPQGQVLKSVTSPISKEVYGFRYPVGKGDILFKKSSNKELLRGQIYQLMFTSPGERIFLPNFGIDLRSYVFEQLDDSLIANLQDQISSQIRLYIPNAELTSIDVKYDEGEYSGIPTLIVYMTIKEKETQEVIPLEFTT